MITSASLRLLLRFCYCNTSFGKRPGVSLCEDSIPFEEKTMKKKKSLIRALYDRGSRIEIGMEKQIVRLAKAVSALLRPGRGGRAD